MQLPGKQTDLIARRQIEGGPTVTLAIECKDEKDPVGNGDAIEFISRVVAQRADSTISSGVMVSSSGFTADARGAAEGHPYVTLLSWEQLTADVLDVRHQLTTTVEEYEGSPIFRNYLPLAIEQLSWASLSTSSGPALSLDEALAQWMGQAQAKAEAPRSLVALADFGAGKTTLLRYLEYDRAKAYLAGEDPRVPLYVPLRDFRQSQDVTALLRASFRDAYYRDPPSDLLWQRVQAGQFYVLLDGFDEMVERSDATRRLDLLHQLQGVLRSDSPTIITSRPSYFVERGELDELVAMLRDHEESITQPQSPQGESSNQSDRLRRKLVERLRENRPGRHAIDRLKKRDVHVFRLLPLDRERLYLFVQNRSDELEEVGASPGDLIDFIERTYDLSDLATRPLLLTLIIESVLIGGLDLRDTDAQLGASGLYEVYTRTKLDLDVAKGRTRQEGLSVEARRGLAEALAIEMYEANTLEVDFHEMLESILRQQGELREQLEASGLSTDEIATDFATCSFVTLDQDGKCRFVHKSFRGFFIARVLKEHIPDPHPLLNGPLEPEVLYFLGGFAPTQPGVGERLWARFVHTEGTRRELRRNVLVAFLYSKPNHDSRRIDDGDIATADFGELRFEGTRLNRSRWSECSASALRLDGVTWREVEMRDSHIDDLVLSDGEIDVALHESAIERVETDGARVQLKLQDSAADSWKLRQGSAELVLRNSQIKQMTVESSSLSVEGDGSGPTLGELDVVDGRVRLVKSGDTALTARRSIVAYEGDQDAVRGWRLKGSLLSLAGPAAGSSARVRPQLRPQDDSDLDRAAVILAPGGISARLLATVGCGVFGGVAEGRLRSALPDELRAWGVLALGDSIGELVLPAETPGCRLEGVLLVGSEWYERETGPGGRLSSVGELMEMAASPPAELPDERLGAQLSVARTQYEAVLGDGWPEYEG